MARFQAAFAGLKKSCFSRTTLPAAKAWQVAGVVNFVGSNLYASSS